MEPRKPMNMVWRHMGETVLYSLVVGGLVVYLLVRYGIEAETSPWERTIRYALSAIGMLAVTGAAYGFWRSYPIRQRLETLRETMVSLEKGGPAVPAPDPGQDEIGQLGEQLTKLKRKWDEQVSSLQRLSTNNAELAEKARMTAVVEERQRLARELHDAVSQQLFAISMTATAALRTMDSDYDRARRQMELIEQMASVAQSEMRALLLHLRPVHLEGKRLTQAIAELVREMGAKVPIGIACDIDDSLPLSRGMEDQLFRIVQEALSNTLRHAQATKLDIVMQRRGDTLRLTVRDNGVGFDTEAKRHASYGLISMEERVSELGGSLNVVSSPGKGTRIEIRVPLVTEGGIDDGG